ncbi:MAG: ABC transporter permease subunit [Pirellulales bacterium]|nr:ABC transporter permease subunit [Pirellulales bacterium]
MNRALWRKAIAAAWLQMVVCGALLFFFGWIFVWLMGLFELGVWASLLKMLPPVAQRMMGVPISDVATPQGQLSLLYAHLITMLICMGWAIGRGSDPISGEITRGTMDLTLTLPVRRASVLLVPSIVAAMGSVALTASLWLGSAVGLAVARRGEGLSAWPFLPGAVNLFALMFALTGITALVSAFNRDRWRTISLVVAFVVVSSIVEMIARMWEPGAWLGYFSLFAAYAPQRIILLPETTWSLSLWYNATLVGLGLVSYAGAAVAFSRRDVPAAL